MEFVGERVKTVYSGIAHTFEFVLHFVRYVMVTVSPSQIINIEGESASHVSLTKYFNVFSIQTQPYPHALKRNYGHRLTFMPGQKWMSLT